MAAYIADILTPDEVDELLDVGIPAEQIAGKTLDHHIWGHLPLIIHHGALRAPVTLKCERKGCTSGQTRTTYLGSGLHGGAWCYGWNENGEYEVNLRDQIYVCDTCQVKS